MRISILALSLLLTVSSAAIADQSTDALIQRALAAGPQTIRAGATVATFDAKGNMTVLRQGSNGFVCVPGTPGVIGDDPMCADPQGMLWVKSLVAHDAKPANTAPGVIYMLEGGSGYSDSDPYQMTGTTVLHDPPHWMLMWPFTSQATGLPDHRVDSGSWIMFPNTPYAHLMILQQP